MDSQAIMTSADRMAGSLGRCRQAADQRLLFIVTWVAVKRGVDEAVPARDVPTIKMSR